AFVLLALLAATLAIPEARSALFRVLHIGGEEIQLVEQLPEVGAQPQLDVVLGRRVSLEQARREAGFHVRELAEKPDRVYLGQRRTVWFVYGTLQHVRLLVAQTNRLAIDSRFIYKVVGQGTQVSEVSVHGARG